MKEHLKERGIWYPIGLAVFLALVLPRFYGDLGWSVGFALATITAIGVGIGACVVVFALWMAAGRTSRHVRDVRK